MVNEIFVFVLCVHFQAFSAPMGQILDRLEAFGEFEVVNGSFTSSCVEFLCFCCLIGCVVCRSSILVTKLFLKIRLRGMNVWIQALAETVDADSLRCI